MAGTKINNFSESDKNLTALMATEQAMTIGHFAISLSEMETAVYPVIKAGSIIEVGGSLYNFTSDETIINQAVDGKTYVKLIPSESGLTAVLTNTAPVWSAAKRGWYGEGTSAGHRYIATLIKSGTLYTNKKYLTLENRDRFKESKTSSGYSTGLSTFTVNVVFSGIVSAITSFSYDIEYRFGLTSISGIGTSNTLTFTFLAETAIDTGFSIFVEAEIL